MPQVVFNTLAELQTYIESEIKTNNNREITGDEMRNILLGLHGFATPKLVQDLTVALGSGNSVGGVGNAEVYVTGTTIEALLRKILIKEIHPTYIMPTFTLGSTLTDTKFEVGTLISPQLNTNYSQNDAGGTVSRELRRNGSAIATNTPYIDTNYRITEAGATYQAALTYSQGPTKINNLGVQDGTGRIQAATILTNTVSYKGCRNVFYGPYVGAVATSADIRLLNKLVDAQEGLEFTITVPAGSTKVAFAYPDTLRDVSSVKYVELGNTEVKNQFSKSSVVVQGANSYVGVGYKVYTYIPVSAYDVDVTYKVTI